MNCEMAFIFKKSIEFLRDVKSSYLKYWSPETWTTEILIFLDPFSCFVFVCMTYLYTINVRSAIWHSMPTDTKLLRLQFVAHLGCDVDRETLLGSDKKPWNIKYIFTHDLRAEHMLPYWWKCINFNLDTGIFKLSIRMDCKERTSTFCPKTLGKTRKV